MTAPRLLFFDLETAPCLGWTWGMYEQNVIDLKTSWYILCFSYKFQGDKKIRTVALRDFPQYRKNREDDSALVKVLHSLFCEADIICAHNGDRFDIRKSNARFIKHGLPPPSPYKTIDTLKIARSKFAFTSNRLGDLGRYFGLGRKRPHSGWDTWRQVMEGERKAWDTMLRYCARDCELLEKVYLKLRAWYTNHPRLTSYTEKPGCPTCQSTNVQRRGENIAVKKKTLCYQCRSCGHWFSQ